MSKIILNSIRTPDGTVLISRHVHDYVEYVDSVSGELYMVDGGNEYLRRSINKIPFEELSLDENSPFELIREAYCRGTFDKDRKRIWVPMSQMSDDHLKGCIQYNKMILGYSDNCFANQMYKKELEYREKHEIKINEEKI